MSPKYPFYLLLILVAVSLSGCSKPVPTFAKVEGTIRVNGKPVDKLFIRFMPNPTKGNDWPINAQSETDAEGHYSLTYFYDGKQGDGAPVGWHLVLIEDMTLANVPQGAPMPPERIPLTYANPTTSTLNEEVKPEDQVIDFDIEM